MLDVMGTKTKLAALAAIIALFVGVMTMAAVGTGHNAGVPAAGLRAADQFAADYTNPNGVDSNNRISAGMDTTAALTATITTALQHGGMGAGFVVTGPATGMSPDHVVVPTDRGPWNMAVTDFNGKWLVSKA